MTLLLQDSGSIFASSEDAPSKIVLRPFSALLETPREPSWLWRGFLAPGLLTMLYAREFEGKSTMLAGLLVAIANGNEFLGRETRQATFVLVSEEDDSAIAQRVTDAEIEAMGGVMFTRNDGVHSCAFAELIDDVSDQAVKNGHELLVVDTFTGLAGLTPEHENDAAAVTHALKPLVKAAGKGCAVLFLHHTRKNGQGGARGSGAFGGVVDVSVSYKRPRGEIILTGQSRYTPLPRARGALSTSRVQDWGEDDVPSSSDELVDGVPERLLAAITASPGGLTYDDFDRFPRLSANVARKRLPRMLNAGLVDRAGKGSKGNPYVWVPPKTVPRRPDRWTETARNPLCVS